MCGFILRFCNSLLVLCITLLIVTAVTTSEVYAVAVDNVTSAKTGTSQVSSLTFSHTVGGVNRYIVVVVSISGSTQRSVNTITYGGQALSKINDGSGDNNTRAELWGRLAPLTGANNVVVTLSGTANFVVGAVSFTAVNQSSPIGTTDNTSGQNSPASRALSSIDAGNIVIAGLALSRGINEPPIPAVGMSQTDRWNDVTPITTPTATNRVSGAGTTKLGPASGSPISVTTSWSWTNQTGTGWAMALAEINSATCGNGLVTAGESCDQGAANGLSTSCCTATCTFRAAGQTCRDSQGVCDISETCSGTSGLCPAVDAKHGNSQICRPSIGECDANEVCDGVNNNCPADSLLPAGSPCGDNFATDCSMPDTCDNAGVCQPNHIAGTCGGPAGDCRLQGMCMDGICNSNILAPEGTLCGSQVNNQCTNPDTCDNAGVCQPNNEPDNLSCGGAAADCRLDGICEAGECLSDRLAPEGTICGNRIDNQCTKPDSCDAVGVCQPNDEPDDTECGGPAANCRLQGICQSGTCNSDRLAPEGTTCGSQVDNQCTNPDSCDAEGDCQPNNEDDDTECGGPAADCRLQGICQAGVCDSDQLAPEGTVCGSQIDDQCTNPDNCDASGVCVPNNEPDDTECGGPAADCRLQGICLAGVCDSDQLAPEGTICGSQVDDQCTNPDTCDASGVCQPNNEPLGIECGGPAASCRLAGMCVAGVCDSDQLAPEGTVCGSQIDNQCTNPDSCDAIGVCLPNNEADDTSCGGPAASCRLDGACVTGVCDSDRFAPAGTACGSQIDDQCTNPDACDDNGICQPNNEPVGTECGGPAASCRLDGMCIGGVCDSDQLAPEGTVCGSQIDNQCTNPDTCDDTGVCLPNNEPDDTECGGVAANCRLDGLCFTGICMSDITAPEGTLCGDQTDDECTDPDTCDSEGNCLPNNATDNPDCFPGGGDDGGSDDGGGSDDEGGGTVTIDDDEGCNKSSIVYSGSSQSTFQLHKMLMVMLCLILIRRIWSRTRR